MTKPRVRLKADGNLIGVSDSLVNITANLGTGRDKASHTTYARARGGRLHADERLSWRMVAAQDHGHSAARRNPQLAQLKL